MQKELMFECKGVIVEVTEDSVLATIFRNEDCDDPKGIKFGVEDFGDIEDLEGQWFTYGQYRKKLKDGFYFQTVVRLLPEEYFTDEEAEAERQRLITMLPEYI